MRKTDRSTSARGISAAGRLAARRIEARRDLHVNAHAVARVCPPEHVQHVIETLYPDLVRSLAQREVQAIVALAIQPL